MKRNVLIIMGLSLTVLLSACKGPVAPADTMQPPQETSNTQGTAGSQPQANPGKAIMDGFMELKNKNATPGELIKFIEPQIGNLEKADADEVLKTLIAVQKLQLENYNEKMFAEEFNIKLNSYQYEDLKALKNIKDADVAEVLKNAFDDGYKLSVSEGMYYLEMDFQAMKAKFSQFVSEEGLAYLEFMAEEYAHHFASDAALSIGLDQLAERTVMTENFIAEYPDSIYLEEIKEWHKNYLSAYLIGLNNTPAFDYDSNSIRQEVLVSFKDTAAKYPESKLAAILKDYMELIKKNDGKKTQEILNFANKASGMSDVK